MICDNNKQLPDGNPDWIAKALPVLHVLFGLEAADYKTWAKKVRSELTITEDGFRHSVAWLENRKLVASEGILWYPPLTMDRVEHQLQEELEEWVEYVEFAFRLLPSGKETWWGKLTNDRRYTRESFEHVFAFALAQGWIYKDRENRFRKTRYSRKVPLAVLLERRTQRKEVAAANLELPVAI